MPRHSNVYTANYSSSSSDSSSRRHARPPPYTHNNTSTSHPANRNRFREVMTLTHATNNHANWEATILSPQYAQALDEHFYECTDPHHLTLIDMVRTADLLATDISILNATAPAIARNLNHVHRKIKSLAFALMTPTRMNQAIGMVIQDEEERLTFVAPTTPPMRFRRRDPLATPEEPETATERLVREVARVAIDPARYAVSIVIPTPVPEPTAPVVEPATPTPEPARTSSSEELEYVEYKDLQHELVVAPPVRAILPITSPSPTPSPMEPITPLIIFPCHLSY